VYGHLVFERFTSKARRVLVVAQDEARNLNHHFIGPEHLLLGLMQGDGIAAQALGQFGVGVAEVRAKVAAKGGSARADLRGSKVPFSPQAKKALEMSLREALKLGHNYIGTEHLVLGVLRATDEKGAGDTAAPPHLLGVTAAEIRARVLEACAVGFASGSNWSPALAQAVRGARQAAGSEPVTTGQMVLAMLADGAGHARQALELLGVTTESFEAALARVPIQGTTDAAPRPRAVEIKLGELTTTIDDPDLAAALGELSPEQLAATLRSALGTGPESAEGGSRQPG
jgi:ATP-dependent Clp protease ATP-binding subunit ClpA